MPNFSDVLLNLAESPIEQLEETCRLLVKIADNILKDPSNMKIRSLQKTNSTISSKIIKVPGGLDCLKLMGFEENGHILKLPLEAPLNKLEMIRNEILKLKLNPTSSKMEVSEQIPNNNLGTIPKAIKEVKKPDIPQETFSKVVLPPFTSIFTNPFLKEIEHRFHLALTYEDANLQERARNIIPTKELEIKAQEKLRKLLEQVKKEKLEEPEINLQDMLILELLSWFKNEFFEWVDSPKCSKCNGDSKFSHMSDDKNLLLYTNRVEMHICKTCKTLTPFPRYTDLNILLETRKGRCGEWANTFTLLCRAMGWDTRHVIDETDHVWSEVYSYSQKRWLHCDPCENVCDTPLMYDCGWKKQISYVIAYSGEEVQDVTWRYSHDHKAVMERRHKCTEEELINALIKLRENRQKTLSKSRIDYLTKRLVNELIELMVERSPSDKDQQGRESGSMAWRLSRGETQDVINHEPYTWIIKDEDIINNKWMIKYSPSSDDYLAINGQNEIMKTISGWQNGAYSSEYLFRKTETDWKMVYLSRTENAKEGKIEWKFNLDSNAKEIDSIAITAESKQFENGKVTIRVCNDNICDIIAPGESTKSTTVFSGSKAITITASLTGGKGSMAWQHAQLFRQSLESKEFPFEITFTFKSVL